MTFSLATRAATKSAEAAVLVTVGDLPPVALSASDSRDLSRALVSAAIEVERGERSAEARSKTSTARRLIRAARVDEQIQERDR